MVCANSDVAIFSLAVLVKPTVDAYGLIRGCRNDDPVEEIERVGAFGDGLGEPISLANSDVAMFSLVVPVKPTVDAYGLIRGCGDDDLGVTAPLNSVVDANDRATKSLNGIWP